ncbi:MAG: dipeptidyl-peptidase [Acidobacteriota bacterium]|nr:dipeptidyl-peptidase [Acidobacteriota bacterium]
MRLPTRTARLVCLTILYALLVQLAYAQKPKQARTPATERSTLVERVGPNGFVQVEADSFTDLSDRQKMLAYWLSHASIAIEPIIYDQMSRFGISQKRILDAIVSNPKGINLATMKKIVEFTKLFWANKGNHNEVTAQKFLPTFTYEELEQSGLQAIRNGALLETPEQFRKELAELKQSLFDPSFEPLTTAKNPRGGLDIIQASANNFYSGVQLADLKDFKEQYPLDSRVVKVDNRLVEQVYRAGRPDGSVPAGLYANYLSKAISFFEKAREYAEPGQTQVIDDLVRFYRTGEMQDWLRFGASWVQNNPPVDFANGFIEVYRDARGAKGTSQSFVSITDERVNKLMTKIADNAQYFENRAPWADQYKKQGVKPPLAKAVETVTETGDFGVSTVGDNLPNEDEIHEKYGTKSFFFTGSSRTLNRAAGFTSLEEFASSPEELAISKKYGDEAEDLETALHEVIGHGSGKVNPKLTKEPASYLKEYYSTLEEARADLMALWNVWDPKLRELGLISHPDVAKAMYYATARAPLTQLRSIPEGDQIEEDHQRDRQLIVNYIMDKTGAIERVERNGKSYMVVKDFDKMREGVGMLLAELMRIKGEGDYNAIKALVDKYAVHFDPKLRDQVMARYKKLNLPTYWTGINATLTPRFAPNGKLMSVGISYPRNYMRQQLEYAAMYDPVLLPDRKARRK